MVYIGIELDLPYLEPGNEHPDCISEDYSVLMCSLE
jgi:hypothetical protein